MKYRIEITEIEPGGLQSYGETIYTQLVSEDDFDLQAIIAAVNFESYPDNHVGLGDRIDLTPPIIFNADKKDASQIEDEV